MGDFTLDEARQVERSVRSLEWEGQPARAVVMRRSYPTDLADLWDAVTDPERIRRWFLPISGELREGGSYQLEGNAGGTILECREPRHLALTWEMNGQVSWVKVTLEQAGEEAARLTLEHIAHDNEAGQAFWDQFGPGAVGVGWDLGLSALTVYLRTGERPMPEGENEWVKTRHGRDFVEVCSAGWRDASIAFGTDVEAAKAAADRTTAFYTGAEPPDTDG